jgi:predicted negative regulator of RcsB-dependent stress response
MAVYDLEEQEQIDALKAWWRDNGRIVIAAVVAVALSAAAVAGWRYWRQTQTLAAAEVYLQLRQAEAANDPKLVREFGKTLGERYGGTVYGAMGGLAAAKAAVATGDRSGARDHLRAVIASAKIPEMRDVARLRLAAVLLDEKFYAEALRALEEKPADSMDALYAGLKGDILAAEGRRAEARAQYQLALDKTAPGSPGRQVTQLKLDALGDAR